MQKGDLDGGLLARGTGVHWIRVTPFIEISKLNLNYHMPNGIFSSSQYLPSVILAIAEVPLFQTAIVSRIDNTTPAM
jgi:hypothetical protein